MNSNISMLFPNHDKCHTSAMTAVTWERLRISVR